MAKATGKTATETPTKKKPAATTKATAARKPAAKKPAAKKKVATKAVKKTVAKKVVAKKPAATHTKAAKTTVKAKKPATTAKTGARKGVRPATRAAKKPLVTRARRAKSAVLEVSPAVIDTSSAAEVAARLVVEGSGVTPVNPLGNLFDPPPVSPVKRGSSALRHVKEALHKPVAAQLESVFGPAPVAPETMRRFLRDGRAVRTQRVRGGTNVHVGQSTVPHRSVG